MDTPLRSLPDAISQISFHVSNYNGVSFHILLNCTRRTKRIRITVAGQDCILPQCKLTPESCDDLQVNSIEFPISQPAYAQLLDRMDEIGVYRWEKRYFADSYPPSEWGLTISRTGVESISLSGVSAYPEEWNSLFSIWNWFARLDRFILISRRRLSSNTE